MTAKKFIPKKRNIFPVFAGLIIVLGLMYGAITSADLHNQIRYLLGMGGTSHVQGTFSSVGNAGLVGFETRPSDGFSGAHLFIPSSGDQVLTGSFWSETVGWINMENIVLSLTDSSNGIWSLSGYAWSPNAGWIDFSGTTYHLSNTSFSGFAWNDGIGWIDISDASIELTSQGAIGKVKIIGNVGGNRIIDTIYEVEKKVPATSTKVINDIRKNVALTKRNIPANKINTAYDFNRVFDHGGGLESINGAIFFENTGSVSTRVEYDRSAGTTDVMRRIENVGNLGDPVYSVIAIGADIHINNSIYPQSDGKPRAFIALKNEEGVGGNIYIDGSITQIYSSLIAEGSLYSGEFSGTTPVYYNNDATRLFRIPNRQLYVYGSIISNNTIGGYGVDNGVKNTCPYDIEPCTDDLALIYDFNHFRDFQSTASDVTYLRAYQPPGASAPLTTYDEYSMIIEHDFRIIDNPPPGLSSF